MLRCLLMIIPDTLSDRGVEYLSSNFQVILKMHSTTHESFCPYTP